MIEEPVPRDAKPPCRGHSEWFIPPDGIRVRERTEAAKHICAGCPFMHRCREWAMHRVVAGVWGGQDERERKTEQRARRIVPVLIEPPTVVRVPVKQSPADRRWQACGEGWGPVRRHEQARESLCQACRTFVNAYRQRKRDQTKEAS